jgi:hypothetical protein
MLLMLFLFMSCSVPLNGLGSVNQISTSDLSNPATQFALNKAFGDLTLVEREQRFRLKIALQRNSHGSIIADIFTPFGSSVAMLSTDSAGGIIEAPQQRYRFSNDDPIATLSYFSNFPFSFGEFVKIITGDYTLFKGLLGQPQSTITLRQTTRFEWYSSSFSATAIVNNRSGDMKLLKAQATTGERWEVSFARFDHGLPREIIYKVDESNYFMLTWDKIVSSQTASTSLFWQP